MSFESLSFYSFWSSFLLCALAVIPYRFMAKRFGMVDRPDAYRKLHRQPVPVGGGSVVFLIVCLGVATLLFGKKLLGIEQQFSPIILASLFLVSPFIILLGLFDDLRGLTGKTKLFFHIVAASVIVGFAKYYSTIVFFGNELNLHHLFYPIAVFWIIGMINSINLLDGADGVATLVGFLLALTTAAIAYINQHPSVALVSLCLSGCLLGFFLHNRPPAKVFLGDTGSMFIGLMLGTLLFQASVVTGPKSGEKVISVCGPLVVVLIPMIDAVFAIIRRVNSGRAIFSPDRGHVHHVLRSKFESSYAVLFVLGCLILPGCLAAIYGMYAKNDFIPLLVAASVLTVAVLADLFGRRELFILWGRIKGRFRKRFNKRRYVKKNGEVYHIQGDGPWREMWNRLIPLLSHYSCRSLKLDISMPYRNEDFYGDWENVNEGDHSPDRNLNCSFLLFSGDRRMGVLRMSFVLRDHQRREELYRYATHIADLCEHSILLYLEAGMFDETSIVLPFVKREDNDGISAARSA